MLLKIFTLPTILIATLFFGLSNKTKISETKDYGSIKLYASDEDGEYLTNNTSGAKCYLVKLKLSRRWSVNKNDNTVTNPCYGHGVAQYCGCPVGKIIFVDAERHCHCIGEACQFEEVCLAPGQSGRFIMSDTYYGDNAGYAVLDWQTTN